VGCSSGCLSPTHVSIFWPPFINPNLPWFRYQWHHQPPLCVAPIRAPRKKALGLSTIQNREISLLSWQMKELKFQNLIAQTWVIKNQRKTSLNLH
jgi:hypothetical protein